MDSFDKNVEKLSKVTFLGGPKRDFEEIGKLQIITLLEFGMKPYSKVLDIGCGCLRGGYWLIHFLNPECYFGIEPNKQMLNAGIKYLIPNKIKDIKKPHFDNNDLFNFSVFNTKFDYFLARSIWTHSPKSSIIKMLDEFKNNSTNKAVLLTSYLKARFWKDNLDYKDNQWVGISHKSNQPGLTYHSYKWIKNECYRRGLKVKEIKKRSLNNKQIWLCIAKQ